MLSSRSTQGGGLRLCPGGDWRFDSLMLPLRLCEVVVVVRGGGCDGYWLSLGLIGRMLYFRSAAGKTAIAVLSLSVPVSYTRLHRTEMAHSCLKNQSYIFPELQ